MRVVIFLLFFYSLALALTPDMAAKNHATYYKKKLPFICTPTLALLEFIEAIKKENLRPACKDKEILNMLSIGVTLDELFYSENGELIFEYTIEDRDCKKFQ